MAIKILVANDDGIRSDGLKILVDWAKTIGEVTICAPAKEQSGKSQSIEIRHSFAINKVDFFDGVNEAYEVDSSPADCVRFGIIGLKRKYDLVFTGINCGYNLGNDILYSGTAAAAFEAVAQGCKAIAFSTHHKTFEGAKANLQTVYDYITKNDLLKGADLLNVNIPPAPTDIKITRKTGYYYDDEFAVDENGLYYQRSDFVLHLSGNLDFDADAVYAGYISVSPLTTDRTDIAAYENFKHLNNDK